MSRSVVALAVGLFGLASASAQTPSEQPGPTVGISFLGCDVDQADVAKRIGFETGANVRLDSTDERVLATVKCADEVSTIEIVDESGQTRVRTIDTTGLSPPALARLLSLTTVELYETRLTEVDRIAEPAASPQPESEPETLITAEEVAAPEPRPTPTRSWSAGFAGLGSSLPALFVSPAILARLQWLITGSWGVSSTALFAFGTADSDIGRVHATSLSASLGATLGRSGSLSGWSAESGARLRYTALSGLSSLPDVETSTAQDFSAGPFVAGLYRWQVLGDFSVLGRAEVGYNVGGATAQADGVRAWSDDGLWVVVSATTGLIW